MKKLRKSLSLIATMIVALVVMAGALFTTSNTYNAYGDDYTKAEANASSDIVYDTPWYEINYSTDGAITVLIDTNIKAYTQITRDDVKDLLNSVVEVAYALVYDQVLNGADIGFMSSTVDAYEELELPDLSNIDISQLEKFLDEQLNSGDVDAKVDALISGKYNNFIKLAVDKYVTEYSYTYDDLTAATNQAIDKIIDKIYTDPVVAEEKKTAINNVVTESVEEVKDAHESGEGISFDVKDFIGAVDTVKIDGNVLFEKGTLYSSAVKSIIAGLPKPGEIANFTDEEMRLTWNVVVESLFGTIDVDLTIGLRGNVAPIRKVADIVARFIDVEMNDGAYKVTFNVPDEFAKLIRKLCNTSHIPDSIKNKIFSGLSVDADYAYAMIENLTLSDITELLKKVDYKKVFNNLLNADNYKKYLGAYINLDGLTNEKIDEMIDKFVAIAIKGLDKVEQYDAIKDYILSYIPKIGDKLNHAIEAGMALIEKFDLSRIDSELIREFVDPNSEYTNEVIYKYIDKVLDYEKYFDKAMEYVGKIYDLVPDRFKDNTILDFYRGNGQFSYRDTIYINRDRIETVLDKIAPSYKEDILLILNTYLDTLEFSPTFEVELNLTDVNKISYVVGGNVVRQGLLPVGATIETFANVTEYKGSEITKWVDADGNTVTVMPDADITVYAVTGFNIVTSEDINKTYDGEKSALTVSTAYADMDYDYTYVWYKNGVEIANSNSATYYVENVTDSATYYCVVTGVDKAGDSMTVTSEDIVVAIAAKEVEVEWTVDTNLTYTGTEKSVSAIYKDIKGADVALTVAEKNGKTAVNVGEYTFVATDDDTNYTLVATTTETTFAIVAKEVEVEWTVDTNLTYTGTEKAVSAIYKDVNGADVTLTVAEKDGKTAVNVGTYTFVATDDDANYVLDATTTETSFTIVAKEVKVEWAVDANLVYDGNEKTISAIYKDVNDADVTLTVAEKDGKTAVNAGTYTFVATNGDANYVLDATTTEKSFTIEKAANAITNLVLDGWTYGETANQPTATAIDGTIVYTYAVAGETNFVDAQPVNAGNYVVKAFVAETENYLSAELTADFTIAQATITVNYTLVANTFEFDGTEKTVELDVTDAQVEVDTVTGDKATDADDYSVTFTLKSNDANYVLSVYELTFDWNITAKEVEVEWTVPALVYTGEDLFAGISASYEGVNGTVNLAITTVAIVNAGDYTLEVTNGDTNYTLKAGTETKTVTVAKAQVVITEFDAEDIEFGENVKVSAKTNFGTIAFVYSTEENGTYTDVVPENANNYWVKAVVADDVDGNYIGFEAEPVDFEIAPKEVDVVWAGIDNLVYSNTDFMAGISAKYVDIDGADVALTVAEINGEKILNAGIYTVEATNADTNYTLIGAEVDVEVAAREVDFANVSWNYDAATPYTYDGTEKTVTLVGFDASAYTQYGFELVYSGNVASNAGKYTAKISISNNFAPINNNFSNEIVWTINKFTGDVQLTVDAPAQIEAGQDIADKITSIDWIFKAYEPNAEYKISFSVDDGATFGDSHPTHSGKYVLRVQLLETENRVGATVLHEYEIVKNVLHVTDIVWTDDSAYVYSGSEFTVKIESANVDIDLADIWDIIEVTYDTVNGTNAATDAGEYTAVAYFALKGNYANNPDYELETTSSVYKWSIAKQQVTPVTEWQYNGAAFSGEVDYNGNKHEISLNVPADAKYTVQYDGAFGTIAGDYVSRAHFALKDEFVKNYELTTTVAEIEWKINGIEITPVAPKWDYKKAFTYDGTQFEVTAQYADDLEYTFTVVNNKATNAGTYTAVAIPVLKNQYVGGYVLKDVEPFTIDWEIKAVEINTKYEWDYTDAFTYDGTEKSVALKDVDSKVDVTYTSAKATDVGTYVAYANVAVKLNYAGNYVVTDSVLTVEWKINTITLDTNYNWNYTDAFTYDGDQKIVALKYVDDKVTVTYAGARATEAGTYTAVANISLKKNYANNYTITNEMLTLEWTINAIVVDVDAITWDYTGAFDYDGTQKTVALSNVPEYVTVSYAGNVATEAGNYFATAVLNTTSNYVLPYNQFSLNWTINAPEPVDPPFEGADGNVTVTDKNGVADGHDFKCVDVTADYINHDFNPVINDETKTTKLAVAYDIHFEQNGTESALTGEFEVKLAIPQASSNAQLIVVHIKDDGTMELVEATRDGNNMVFTATDFSVYAIVEVQGSADMVNLVLTLMLITITLISMLLVVIILNKRAARRN
ncbi:MAG: hypothetical protein J6B79_06785 [Clostridia bacterium]|nr:hypothetical protein [Clostridia bacterium]